MGQPQCSGVNVVEKGADPDGGRDSTRAFNDAINALPDTGGIVCIPAGRYRIDGAPLIPDRYVTFKGAGGMKRSAAPRRGSATTLVFPDSDADGFRITNQRGASFEDLALVHEAAPARGRS